MGRKNSKKSYRRDLVDSYISTVQNQIAQEQARAQAQMQQPDYAKGLTRADVDNYINSYNSSQEIPKLEQNTTPTPSISDELKRMEKAKADTTTPRTEGEQKAIDTYYDSLVKASGSTPTQSTPTTDYKAEIERMNALKADTSANRTEGENKAIEDYLNGLQEAQAYVDSQKPKTTTQKKTETVEKKKVDPERAQYERQIVKANFDKAHPEINRMAEARAIGRKALEDAKNGKIVSQRVLSTNEQRDYERAKEAEAKQLRAEKKEVSVPETANENVGDELTVGKIAKPLQNPKDKVQNFLQPLKDLETDPIYDDRGFEINQSRTDKIKKSQEFIDDVNNYNAWRGSQADLSGVNPIATIVKSNISKKLQEKYDLDEETLNELANEIKYEASNQRGQEAVENAKDYGEAHPFKGSKKSLWSSVGSALFTPTQMADDIANYVYNGQKASPYEGAHQFSQEKRALREGVKENIGFAPLKGAYDVGMGLADLGVSATAGALGGLPPAVGLALNTANDATTSALERGSNPLIANAYGAISGGADFVLNTIGLDKAKDLAMERITVQGIPKLLKQMGIAGNYEGLENLLQDGVQKATDEILNGGLSYLLGEGYNSEIAVSYKNKIANGESPADAIIDIIKDTAIQEVTSYLTGVGMGAGTQGFNTAVNELYARSFFDDLNKQSERVQEKLRAYKEGRLNPLEQSIAETNNVVDEIPRVEEQIPTRQLPENVEDIPKDVNDYVRTRDNLIAKANEANISGDSAEVNRLVDAVQRMDDYIKANYPEWMNGRFFNRAEYDKLNPTEKSKQDPYRWGNTADEIIAKDSYARNQDFIKLEKNISKAIDDERVIETKIDELRTQLKKESFEKPKEEWDTKDEILAMLSKSKPEKYTDEGQRILGEIKNLEAQKSDINANRKFLEEERDYSKAKARLSQLENFEQNEFVPATREKYQGFSTTKGNYNDEVKSGKAQLVEMSPDEYIRRCVYEIFKDDNRTGGTLESILSTREQSKIDNYARQMLEGTEFDTPYLDYKNGGGQEGLHRALAAKKAGINVMPVVVRGTPPDASMLGNTAKQAISDIDLARNDRKLAEIGFDPDEFIDEEIASEINNQDTNLYKRGVEEGLKNETPEYEQTTLPIENPTEEVPNEPKAPETRERRTINTLKKAGVLTQKDIDRSPELQAVKDYTVKHNIESMANAQEDVDKNAKNLIKEYSSGKRQAKTDEDVDKTMIMLTDKNIKKTRAQKNAMMINLAENGTEGGRFIQAFAKWANTSTDALVKATKLMLDDSKGWASRNTKQKDHNARLAKALAEMGHKPEEVPEKIPPTHEDIKRGAIAELNKEFGSIEEKLNDTDFEFVTSMLENNVPTWQIADEIEHRLKHGEWYPIDESLPLPVEEQSSKLAKILDSVVGGKELVKEKTVKPEESIYDQMKRIRNTIENSEAISFAKDWNDDDYFVIAQMFENNVPNWEIADEIRHRAEHGVWYTRDESTPVKVQKSKQLAKMLNNVVNGNQPKAEKAPKSYSEFLTEIRNTIESEPSSISKIFNDADYYFIGQMMQEGVPQWLMEDELRHKVETGDWFTIDESINAPKPTNQRLKNAFDMLVNEQVRVEPERKSIAQYREEVRNTLNNSEFADMAKNFNDSDVDYLANLMEQGATTKEISDALNMKLATGKWGISEEAQNQVNDLFEMARHYDENSKEFVEAQAEAFRILAEEVNPKASPMEKFDAWRYMAMLGNPKTMLRNYVGNKMFGAVTGASNSFAALIEAGVDKQYFKKTGQHIQRTKALLNPKQDKALINMCKEDAYGKRYRNIEGSKYEKSTTDAIKQQANTFDSKIMQLAEKAVDRGISDTKAVVNKYGTSLAGYMKANGLDESYFNDSYRFDALNRKSKMIVLDDAERAEMESLREKANAMEDARDYALKQAEYATFHEDNAVAEWLANMSRTAPGAGKMIIEGVVPFKKTPANILKSGFEYSPFGAIDSIRKTGKLIMENTGKNKGNLADEYSHKNFLTGKTKNIQKTLAHEVIDSWSKTLTGSALALFGSYLFDKGVLTSSNDGEKYQDQKEGIGNYALNINGHTFTLDWAAPGVMPLLVGAEFKKIANDNAVLNQHWYENPDRMLETINALLDPMFETSMMSGVKDTFQTAANELRYNDEKSKGAGILGTVASNALTGYFAQALPTFSGQIARTVDPIRRTTDTYNEGFLGGVEKQARKTMNKIPFLSMLNTPYIDASGEYQYNSPFESTNAWGVLGNLAYQTLIPSYYNKKHTTVGDEKAREIYNATYENEDGDEVPIRDSDVFSDWRTTKTINGERLNPKELQEFRTEMGLANEDLKARLAESDWFNELSYQDQNDIYKSLNNIADKIGQYAVRPDSVNISSKLKTYVEAGEGEEGLQAIVDQLEAEYNPYGLSTSAYNELKESGEDMSDYEGYAEELSKYGLKDNQYNRQLWKDEEDLSGYEGYAEALEDLGVEGSDKYRKLWIEGDKKAFVEQVRYDKAFEDAGMDTSYDSKSAKQAYQASLKNPAILEKYAHYRQWLKSNDVNDSEDMWANYQSGNADKILQEKQVKAEQKQAQEEQFQTLEDYGFTKKGVAATYEKAQSEIPSLTTEGFAKQYKAIDKDHNEGIKQDEIIDYLNSGNYTKEQGEQIWRAYGNSTWKKIPVLEGDTWTKK